MVSYELTAQQAAVVGRAVEHGVLFGRNALVADRERRIQPEVFEVIRGSYLDLRVPKQYGGQGVDAVSYGMALPKLAYGDAAATLDITMHNFVVNVLGLPGVPEEVKAHYFKVARRSLLCAAVSEPGASSHDAKSFIPQKVVATPLPGGGYELWGPKSVVTGCDLASHVMVFARIADTTRTVCVMVSMDDENLHTGDGWNSSKYMTSTNSHPIEFKGVRVSSWDVVLEMDDFLGTVMMQEGAITFASIAVYAGIFRRLLDIAVKTVKERIPNGSEVPLSYLQHIASDVLTFDAMVEQAENALYGSFRAYDQRRDEATTLEAFAAMCKAKWAITKLVESVPKLTELVSHAATSNPLFELGARDLGAGNLMPPNTPTATMLGGYALLLGPDMAALMAQ